LSNFSGKTEINALDFIGEIASNDDFYKAEQYIRASYGLNEYEESKSKFNTLWSLVKNENWTSERLIRTTIWFLKSKKFATWTIADWFEYGVTLHPYSWYLEQISLGNSDRIEAYKVNGQIMYKLIDGQNLPFDKFEMGKSNKLQIDFSNAIAYYRQELKSEPTENERKKMLEKIETVGIQYVIDKIDENKKVQYDTK